MNGEPISIAHLLKRGRERLSNAPCHDENYVNEALYLLQEVIEITREELISRGGEVVSPVLVHRYSELISRRIAGEPLQYILGKWEFYGLTMKVGSGVLIPRPETEELVEYVLKLIKPIKAPAVLDLCSGSGCIPIAIAHNRHDAQVYGVELSEDAFKYFTENALLCDVKNVTPVKCNIFSLPVCITERKYDVITSNPPYITTSDLATLQTEVRYEPSMALDGGGDGLDFYRKIPSLVVPLLNQNGLLAMEIGSEQGKDVSAFMVSAGFRCVTVRKDFSGNDRIVTGIIAM